MSQSKAKKKTATVQANGDSETVGNEIIEKVFRFSTGRELKIVPISPMFMDNAEKAIKNKWIKENGELPEPPTYEVLVGDGEEAQVQLYEYDDDSISDGSPEEQKAYQDYLDKLTRYTQYTNSQLAEVLLRRGVVIDYPDGWENDYLALGMEIPEDPYEKKIYYIENEAVGAATDYALLIKEIMALTGVDMGLVEEALSGFRTDV